MIDLPDYGYTSHKIVPIDPNGIAEGSLGGADDFIPRLGFRYACQFMTRPLVTADEARIFLNRLERAAATGEDASYPFPLDFKSPPAGAPRVNGSSPAGAVIPVRGLTNGFPFREGQWLAVISGGVGFMHRVKTPTVASSTGTASLPAFPWTRQTFADGDVIEVERPRIRGKLSYEPPVQDSFGRKVFSFTIREWR